MYSEIKNNIVKNFLNKGYLYTCGCSKSAIVDKIIENSIFTTNYNYDTNVMTMKLGDNVDITFDFDWELTSYINKLNNKEVQHYKLIKIK